MNLRSEKDQQEMKVANPSKRARLDALLFGGVKVGTALLALAVSAGPKTPPWQGE